MSIVIFLAVSIIVVLVIIALYLHWKLHKKNLAKKNSERQRENELRDKRLYAIKSIKILANATIEEQVTLTETSIRIGGLAKSFPLSKEELDFHQCFFHLANETSHIPYLDKWQALDKKQKREYTQERETIEKKYRQEILTACESIVKSDKYLKLYV